jgi:GcrA cell cycle regulator
MWTEAAIETLKQLALEGKSASSIAAAIGAPSRNAVIGKANRIGIKLNGNVHYSAPRAPRPVTERPRRPAIARTDSVLWKRAVVPAIPRERKPAWLFAEAQVGEMLKVGLEEIREGACRWPLGDPTCEDFAYCGLQTAKGRSYCAGHCRMAYRPPKTPARERRRDGDGVDGGWLSPRIGRRQGDFTEIEVKELPEPAAERFAEAHRPAEEL